MIKLSICMMVKNEEKNIRRCLESLKQLVNKGDAEIVILDTGSNDSTVAIASEYTNRIFHQPWNDNFSEMRNLTIQYAQGEWILIIDADEVLVDSRPIQEFLEAKHSKDIVGAVIALRNAKNNEGTEFGSALITPRIFRRSSDIRYEGIVHNLPHVTGKLIEVKAELHHFGYISSDKDLMEKKFIRTKTLIEKALSESPDNVYLIYQLSVTYDMHKDIESAYLEVKRAYEAAKRLYGSLKEYQYIFSGYAKLSLAMGHFEEVLKVCEEGIQLNDEYIDLYFFKASAHIKRNEYSHAIETYKLYLNYLTNYNQLAIRVNPSIQLYTLGLKYEAYCNSSIIAYRIAQYDYAYNCAKMVVDALDENSEYFLAVIETYVNILIQRNEYDEFEHFYQKIQQKELRARIINKIIIEYILSDNIVALFEFINIDSSKLNDYESLIEETQFVENSSLKMDLISSCLALFSLQRCDLDTFEVVEKKVDSSSINLIIDHFFGTHIPADRFKVLYEKFQNDSSLLGLHCLILSHYDDIDFLINHKISEDIFEKLVSFDKNYYRMSLSFLLVNRSLLNFMNSKFSDLTLNNFMIQLTELKTLLRERLELSLHIINNHVDLNMTNEKIIRFYLKTLLSIDEQRESKFVEAYHKKLYSYLINKYQWHYISNEMIENFTNNEEAYGIALIRSGYFDEINEPKWLVVASEIFPITAKYLSSVLSSSDISMNKQSDDLEVLLEKEILKLYNNGDLHDAIEVLKQGLELRPNSSILINLQQKLKNNLN